MSKCLAPTRRILSNFAPLTNQHFGRRIHSQAPFQLNNKQTSCTTTKTHKRPNRDNFFPNRSILSRTMSANLSTASSQDEPIKYNIIDKITSNLNPSHLEVVNESYMHNVPKGSETHFKVLVVSESFGGQNRLARHRAVNKLLTEEMENGPVHALSILAHTHAEWEQKGKPEIDPSPKCRGGFGK